MVGGSGPPARYSTVPQILDHSNDSAGSCYSSLMADHNESAPAERHIEAPPAEHHIGKKPAGRCIAIAHPEHHIGMAPVVLHFG